MRTLLNTIASAALAGALAAPAAAQIYQLALEDCVRRDDPRLQPRLDWILDPPPVIDKQSFRALRNSDYEEHSVFVRFLPQTPEASRNGAHALARIRGVVWQSRLVPDLYLVRVGDLSVLETIHAYLDHPDTLYAEPSYRSRLATDPDDFFYSGGAMYGMGEGFNGSGIHAHWAWDEWQGDQSFVIAIIDSGVQISHPDLVQNLWQNPGEIPDNGIDDDGNGYKDDVVGWDFSSMQECLDPFGAVVPCSGSPLGDNDPTPTCSEHGTHVAGTVGARGNNGIGVVGVNWRCSLMALKCEIVQGPNCDIIIANTILAFDYAVANGARVSNNSYGHYSTTIEVGTHYDEILAAQAFGHLFIAAAGNDKLNVDAAPNYHYPSGYTLSNIISVAGLEGDGDLATHWGDCDIFGTNCDKGSNWGATSVDLAAPGDQILSTVLGSGYGLSDGTSMAAPHVAGSAALVWSRYPELLWWQVRDRLLGGVTANTDLAGKCTTGGHLQVQRALGVWAAPGVPFGGVGSKLDPLSVDGTGLVVATASTPTWGTLNFKAGTVTKSAIDFAAFVGFGTKTMTIRANGGTVRLGVP